MANTSLPKEQSTIQFCGIDGCDCVAVAKRMCDRHYRRVRRLGTPFIKPKSPMPLRFWEKATLTANKDKCWNWTASRDADGYGHFRYTGRDWLAHRLAWQLKHGSPAPTVVRHRCDNPSCVNPAHLLAGTHSDNMADMSERNRSTRGSRSARSKLVETQVIELWGRVNRGEKLQTIADDFGVNESTIRSVVAGRTWRHVPKPIHEQER